MIRINLLPHREIKRKAREQQIAILAGIVCFSGILVVWGISSMISDEIDYQNRRNQFLTDQTAILDKQITEIKDIKGRTQELLARKNIVETLQNSRSSPHLESALLVEIKAINVNNARQNEFNMKVKYNQTDSEE